VTTWLGIVGPGVRSRGVDGDTWSDHTDIRPTILSLTGLTDDYAHDGRVLVETLKGDALPDEVERGIYRKLAVAYKEITAPVGELGLASLAISTTALAGDDETYANLETLLADFTSRRDALAARMIQALENAAFSGQEIDESSANDLIDQAHHLLSKVKRAAGTN
jgi:hypothetical protein